MKHAFQVCAEITNCCRLRKAEWCTLRLRYSTRTYVLSLRDADLRELGTLNIMIAENPTKRKPKPQTLEDTPAQRRPLGSIANIASLPLKRLQSDSDRKQWRFALQDIAASLLPDERVATCCRHFAAVNPQLDPHFTYQQVDVYHDGNGDARFDNLQTCGSVWHCPVCAARITEQRRKELSLLIHQSKYKAILATYTIRHTESMSLYISVSRVKEAFRKLKSGRWWQDFKECYSWIGDVTSAEVTHGGNGWHPHLHVLMLFDRNVTGYVITKMQSELRDRWLSCLERVGLDASWERGVDLRHTDEKVREYVAKYGDDEWTIEHELTKSGSKIANKGSRTPFQILADAGNGCEVSKELFLEYAQTMKGRNQLVWSRGLKDHLKDIADESELIEIEEEDSEWEYIGSVSKADWKLIVLQGRRYELWKVATYGDVQALQEFLWIIRNPRGLHRQQLFHELQNHLADKHGRNAASV